MSTVPIADYALLSDCHSAALTSRMGSVDWLCFPRFDAPSIFGRLLDDTAGHWSIRPVGEVTATRQYVDGTLVLDTIFETPTGVVQLRDALAVGRNERGHELGAGAPHALLRTVTCTKGTVELEMEFAPRPEYGLVRPLLAPVKGGLRGRGGASVVALSAKVDLHVAESVARARFTLRSGKTACFALQHASSSEPAPELWSDKAIQRRMEDTIEAWRSWSKMHQNYDGPWKDLVMQSGRVLQGLTYYPTGAIVAAATTSLPETVGGSRNWDYRFTWVRDASFTLEALWVAACPDEAYKFFDFLTGAALSHVRGGTDLQIMFGIGGEHDLTERELPHLSGWRGSRPVRIGNGAWNQRQIDVYGELMGAVYRLRDRLTAPRSGHEGVPGRGGRHGEPALEGEGPGHLGSAGRAARFPLLETHVLGGPRPRHRTGARAGRQEARQGMDDAPRGDPPRDPRARLERAGRRLHPVLRLGRSRRVEPDDPDRRISPSR